MRQGYAGTTASIINRTMPSITTAPKADITGALKTFADARYQAEKQQREREMYQKYLKDEEALEQNQAAFDQAVDNGDYDTAMKIGAKLDRLGFIKNRMKQQAAEQENAWENERIKNAQDFASRQMYIQDEMKRRETERLSQAVGATLTGNDAYDRSYLVQKAKDNASAQKYEKAVNSMHPTVSAALDRAEKALESGSGIGIVGGIMARAGLNPLKDAGKNFADITTANSQMNTYLRQALASTGLTGGELNAAQEAEAYRYTISPYDDEDVIRQKIANFRHDYLDKNNLARKLEKFRPGQNTGGSFDESDPLGIR